MLEPSAAQRDVGRRRLLVGMMGVGGAVAIGGLGLQLAPGSIKRQLGLGPDPYIPDAPEGRVRLETVDSQARARHVQLFTAVPAGYGDGRGLPVVAVLHGASATPADYQAHGLARFLTEAVRRGAPPFVLAGADGGVLGWEPDVDGGDDPQAMVVHELPDWLAERGFDSSRRALWGWSMGAYGVLRLAEDQPGWAVGTAAFSPAITSGDRVFTGVAGLMGQPLGLWCGDDDPYYDATRELITILPQAPQVLAYGDGTHGWVYWSEHTLDAFAFLGRMLSG